MTVSGCCFVGNAFTGAFTVFESMASMLPFVDEFVVMVLPTRDGSDYYLERIAEANKKVRLVRGEFPSADAGAFADLANDLIGMCEGDAVWYCQADEVPHEGLLKLVGAAFAEGKHDWSLWRVQLGYNFQEPRWYPHPVHRIGPRNDFRFVGDGMNTDRVFGVDVLSSYDASWFPKWGELGEEALKGAAMREMLLDVSLLGGFRDNVVKRRALHAPFWHEEPLVPYRKPGEGKDRQLPAEAWRREAGADGRWTRKESPFDLPRIMRWHVGQTTYRLRRELFEALCEDSTRELLGIS